MLDPSTIASCGEEDWEVVDQCDGPNPTPDDDDDDDDDGPPGGGDPNTPPSPGPGPLGPCDPGDPPEGFGTPIGPSIFVASPGPATVRVLRHYPFQLAGSGGGSLGPGAPITVGGASNIRIVEVPCPPFNPNDPFACTGNIPIKIMGVGGTGYFVSVGRPSQGALTEIPITWRVEDYDQNGNLVGAWEQDCTWISPDYPLLTVTELVTAIHDIEYPGGDPPLGGSSLTVEAAVRWSTQSPVFPPGSFDHKIEIQGDVGDPLFGSVDSSILVAIDSAQPWTTLGVGTGIGAKCLNSRVSNTVFQTPHYFRARFVWSNPGPANGPWSPTTPIVLRGTEAEPLWTIDPNYCLA